MREVARKDKDVRFTALLDHVDLSRLWAAYVAINPKAATGVDKVTWEDYGQDLRANLEDLLERVHSGAYRARPSRRVYIPKPDGRMRPLGIAALEDKIVQRAVVEVLNAIYEEDFLGFSYGFRPGRKPHDALDALAVGISEKKVNWILDADVSDFFSKLDQAWLRKFLEHRIADRRVLRLKDLQHLGQGTSGAHATPIAPSWQLSEELLEPLLAQVRRTKPVLLQPSTETCYVPHLADDRPRRVPTGPQRDRVIVNKRCQWPGDRRCRHPSRPSRHTSSFSMDRRQEGGSDSVHYADLIGPIAAPHKESSAKVGITRRSA
ncbi:MAG: reverse transcriptase domain-containing protein [Acidimicrobiales bacterium]